MLRAMPPLPESLKYGDLKREHPEYRGPYVERLRAFYRGGVALMGDARVMGAVFPRHNREALPVYDERCRRAFYIGVAGEIIDSLVASLGADPVRVAADGAEDAWYGRFWESVGPWRRGRDKISMSRLLLEQAREMLIAGVSWVRVDLPLGQEYASLGEQERAGGRAAYLVPVPAENVIDWEEDNAGVLDWVVTYRVESPRSGLTVARDRLKKRWTFYTRSQWAVYELEHQADARVDDATVVPRVAEAGHSFGAVPLVRKRVPDGLWAMDTMEGLARELFNKRSALGWAELQSLLPELYEFKEGYTVEGDDGRSRDQPRGQGYVQERGSGDRAEFIGPPPGPFGEARQSCQELRDEMHRVMHQMALSVTGSASMLGRSAASKQQDQAATQVILVELGRLQREHAEEIAEMVSAGRGDEAIAGQWRGSGGAVFGTTMSGDAVAEAVQMTTVPIDSPTFWRTYRTALAKTILGPSVGKDVLEIIEKELAESKPAEVEEKEEGKHERAIGKQRDSTQDLGARPDRPTDRR